MSFADDLLIRVENAKMNQERRREEDKAARAKEEDNFQREIFLRVDKIFQACLEQALKAADRGEPGTRVKLADDRFDRTEFDKHINAWRMTVLALQEHGLQAEFKLQESLEWHEMNGCDQTLYTPYIYMSWTKK